ncbi:unnamed protein product [Prorocentrum cordatum]|uniref:Uncharacterized protein n=1 Tax=Prorocentrum cordatum TaxID=2364126 RepID=A0ABN9XR45_9DINO|nr:unnamed protein product [Polarella glacialis]
MVGLTPIRWVILLVMFWLGMMQGLVWMTLSGNPDVTKRYYALVDEKATIDLLLNWGPIMYLPVVPLVTYGAKRGENGVWATILAGAMLTAAGSLLRLAPSVLPFVDPASEAARWFLHGGQMLNGCAGPMNAVTPSLLAAMWFPPAERAFATATVFSIQAGAPALGFLLALPVHTPEALQALMAAEAASSVAVALVWAVLPKRPLLPPSGSQSLRRLAAQGDGEWAGGPAGLPRRRWVSSATRKG